MGSPGFWRPLNNGKKYFSNSNSLTKINNNITNDETSLN